MALLFGDLFGSKVVIIEKDANIVGEVVKETGTIGGGGEEGVDKWAVREVFKAVMRGVSLSKPGKSGGWIF